MKLIVAIITVVVLSTLLWWQVSSSTEGESKMVESHQVARRTFKVTLQEKGELQAAESIDVTCEVGGRSTIISLIPEGSHVEQGDLLVELASNEIEERLQTQRIEVAGADASLESARQQLEILQDQNQSSIEKAQLKLELAELELNKYTGAESKQKFEDAELRLAEAKRILDRKQEELSRKLVLKEKDFISETDVQQAEFDAYKAGVEHDKAIRDRAILKDFTHVKDLKQRESDFEEAKKELERVVKESAAKDNEAQSRLQARKDELELKRNRLVKLESEMSKTKIYAPAPGLVVYGAGEGGRWGNEDQIKEGVEVRERQTLLRLPDTSTMKVVVRIHEGQTDKISEGQSARIQVEGVNHREFTGKITKIAVLADSQNRWLNPELKEYETEITLDQSDVLLKPGATAHVEILIAELADVIAVPIQSVYRRGDRSFVFVGPRSDQAQAVEVQLGLASEDFVEITTGLELGRPVLLAASDELKRALPEARIPSPAEPGQEPAPAGIAQQAPAETPPAGGEVRRGKDKPREEQKRGGEGQRAGRGARSGNPKTQG